MKIVYVSRNKMYVCNNGKVSELPCERAEKYTTAVNEINKNKEWKHSARICGPSRPTPRSLLV